MSNVPVIELLSLIGGHRAEIKKLSPAVYNVFEELFEEE